jgi:hypothetical protein
MTDATHLATGAPTRGVRVEDMMRAILSLESAILTSAIIYGSVEDLGLK